MKLSVITGNAGKFREISTYLNQYAITTYQVAHDLEEIQSLDLKAVIEHKAQQVVAMGYTHSLVEDTALYFDGLKRLPGTFIKWFLAELGCDGLYTLAEKVGNRNAQAQTIIAYIDGQKRIHYFLGATKGQIVSPQGGNFGWSDIFKPDGADKRYGQMTFQQKEPYGQRFRALKELVTFLKEGK